MAPHDNHEDRGFLTSPGNVVGVGALVVLFLIVLLVGQSLPAAVIAGLLGYGAGYFLAPDELPQLSGRATPAGPPREGASEAEMHSRLTSLRAHISRSQKSLPPDARDQLTQSLTHLGEMVERWDTVVDAPDHRHIIESIVYDYLPHTLDLFLRLPDTEKPKHAAEWSRQLSTLAAAINRSREAVLRQDVEAMRTQGILLEQRFEDGDLTMFREHGL